MALTTEQVALWKRNAQVVKSYATDMNVQILQARIIALADEVLANREAQPVAWIVEGDGVPKHLTTDREYAYMYPERTTTPLYTAPPAVVNGRTAEGWMAEALLQKNVADALRKSLPCRIKWTLW